MIYIASGKTGSGKTVTAVAIVYKMWRNGRNIWSNTPLFFTEFDKGNGGENIVDNPEYFTSYEKLAEKLRYIIISKLFKKKFRPSCRGTINYFDTIDETFHIKDSAILFDEGQTLFRNYDWEHIPRLFLYKIEQNRKHGLDLITTAQRMKAVNINYRELIQYWFHFERIIPEKAGKLLKIHLYREIKIDEDFITEPNVNIKEIKLDPDNYKSKWRMVGFWSKKLYDSYFDIGFEPLQHYEINIGQQQVNLHIESGMTVRQALAGIRVLKTLYEL